MRFLSLALASLFALSSGALNAGTIAVSEFLSNPDGQDSGREFIEIYNYGSAAVDLTGYTVTDEDSDSYALPSVSIAPLDFLILVNTGGDMTEAQAKSVFETAWLSGQTDPRVIGADLGALSNSDDEIILGDGTTIFWSLAYENDEDEDSTVLTDGSFGTAMFGTKAAPGIDRSGDDNGVTGFLGYEDSGDQPMAWTEDIAAIDDGTFLTSIGLDADFYDGIDASEANPLALTAVPEPALNIAALLAMLFILHRNRRC